MPHLAPGQTFCASHGHLQVLLLAICPICPIICPILTIAASAIIVVGFSPSLFVLFPEGAVRVPPLGFIPVVIIDVMPLLFHPIFKEIARIVTDIKLLNAPQPSQWASPCRELD